jgi:hypothetical protein
MRASEFITEVFQSGKRNWEWKFRGSEEAIANFTVGGRTYQWVAYSHVRIKNPTKWEIQFRLLREEDDPDELDVFGTTGTGNSAEVLSTAVDITRTFLKEYGDKVLEITFNAKENSRIGLYAKMINRLLPDWDLHQRYVNNSYGMEFYLTNPRAYELHSQSKQVDEEIIDEMPLPVDWDPQQMRQGATTFKSRLKYALDRAKKLGVGSSRVATTIEYQGRPTVLKIAKNAKGLAQNSVEADILSDGYASQMGILIPIIDYDTQNREPSWVHTELASKVSDKQLCSIMKCDNLGQLVNMAWSIIGKKKYLGDYQSYITHMRNKNKSEEDIDTMIEYANTLAELNSQFDVQLDDFMQPANWGMYQGKPVIVDVGFNSNVMQQYYKR